MGGERSDEPGLVELQEAVGRRLAEHRRQVPWSQEEAAARLGIGVRRLQAIEAGEVNLTLRSLARFARVYGVGVASLFA